MALPQFVRAPVVLLVLMVLLAVLFGPLSAAIEPLFGFFRSSAAVQNSEVVGVSNIDRIADVLFIQGPIVLVAGAVLFLVLAALRLEGVLR